MIKLNISQFRCKEIVDVESILSSAVSYEYKRFCGIYFLIYKGEIQYVGQSVNAMKRIAEHATSGKLFDSFSFLECPYADLDFVESAYIHTLNPPQQGRTRSGSCHAPMTERRLKAHQ